MLRCILDLYFEGVEAVTVCLSRRWLDLLVDEEEKSRSIDNETQSGGWLTNAVGR